MSQRALILMLFCLLGLSSCDESSQTAFAPTSLETQPYLFAEVDMGTRLPGAVITLETMDGQVLGTRTADEMGYAVFRDFAVPDNFRARAQIGESDVEFVLEVHGYHSAPRHCRLSLLTTLRSLYERRRPDLTQEERDRRLRHALVLPSDLDLEYGLLEPNPVFSELAFVWTAARSGGWEALVQKLLDDADAERPHRYILTHEVLTTPFTGLSGLDPALAAAVEVGRERLQRRTRVSSQTVNGQRPVSPFISLIDGPSSLGGQFLLGIGTGLAGNLVTDGVGAVLGWAANQMGLNYGTGAQLQDIAATLQQVLGLVQDLVQESTVTAIEDQLQELNSYLIPVQTGTVALQNDAMSSAAPTNEPFTPPSSVATLVTDIETPDYPDILASVQDGLTGSASVTSKILTDELTNSLGIDQPSRFGYVPWRTNHVLDESLPAYQYFALQQVMALNLYAEEAHNSLINADPVVGVNSLLPTFQQAVQSLKIQRQQLPVYSGSWVPLVDLENGIMWSQEVNATSSTTTWSYANGQASTYYIQMVLPDGTSEKYTGWTLPTYGQCLALQQRGMNNPNPNSAIQINGNNPYPNIEGATAGLPGLGFWFGSNGTDWTAINSDGNIWMSEYDSDGSTTTNNEFRLNHNADSNTDNKTNNDTNAYIFCRTLGDQSNGTVVPWSTDTISTAPPPAVLAGAALVPGEGPLYGVLTSISDLTVVTPPDSTITIPGLNGSPDKVITLPENAQLITATLNYTVNLGGSFNVGFGTVTPGNTLTSYAYPLSVPTADISNNVNTLQQWVAWSGSDASVAQVLNLPGLDGILIPYQAGSPMNVIATVQGPEGLITESTSFSAIGASPHTLTGIQITPRNQIFGPSTRPASGSYPIYCSGFFSDGTMDSLADSVQWTVTPTPNDANARITIDSDGALLQLNQPGVANAVPYNLTITATSGGFSDSMEIQIVPPPPRDPNAVPTINKVNPGVGSTAGGYPVELTGLRLSGTTLVRVGANSVPFVVNTANEVTILNMPSGSAGAVQIILSTPDGDATANFQYQ